MSTREQARYEVIERLDAGGMAEVFRGKSGSVEGFEKQVAIKRVLPHLAKNEKFVKMFLDEAKLSLHLDHANIVHVFDLAHSGETYFIVMEYVDGMNLKKLLEATRAAGERLPVQVAFYIGVEVCKALAYAHERKDSSSRPLGIVHRDVSPPNILLSWEGEVKLTDFGLAKAATQLEATDPGVVKGKFGYLSPEAAWGEGVDHRTDIFAVGIVVWEMLSGKRLFQGQTDQETLLQVRECQVPSLRQFQAALPPSVDEILGRALARDPSKRYQTAREFGLAMSQFLFSVGLGVTSYDIAALMQRHAQKKVEAPGNPGYDPGRQRVMREAIQREIDRLTRVDGHRSVTGVKPTQVIDPREWKLFEDGETDGLSGALYAAKGTSDPSVHAAIRRVVTGIHPSILEIDTPPPNDAAAAGTPIPSPATITGAAPGTYDIPAAPAPAVKPRSMSAMPGDPMAKAARPAGQGGSAQAGATFGSRGPAEQPQRARKQAVPVVRPHTSQPASSGGGALKAVAIVVGLLVIALVVALVVVLR
jgi:serine/threonine-protein kinase